MRALCCNEQRHTKKINENRAPPDLPWCAAAPFRAGRFYTGARARARVIRCLIVTLFGHERAEKNTTRVLARLLSALADTTPECIQIITHTTQICGYALLRMFPIYLALSGRASPACASTPRRSSRCLRVRVRAVRTHASSTHGDTCARNRIYMSDCGPTDRPTARPPARPLAMLTPSRAHT